MTTVRPPTINDVRNNANFRVRQVQGRFIAESNQQIRGQPQQSFTYDSSGNLITGAVRGEIVRQETRNKTNYGVYDTVSFNREGGNIVRRVYNKKGSGNNVYRERAYLLEKEVYTPGGKQLSRVTPQATTRREELKSKRIKETKEINKLPNRYIPKSRGSIKVTPRDTVIVYDPSVNRSVIVKATPQNLRAIEQGRLRTLDERKIISLARKTGTKITRNAQGNLQLRRAGKTTTILHRGASIVSVTETGKPTAKFDAQRIGKLGPKFKKETKKKMIIGDDTIGARKFPPSGGGLIDKGKNIYFKTISKRIDNILNVGQYIRQQQKLDGSLTTKEKVGLASVWTGYVGLRALRGITAPFLKPIETVKGMGIFAKDAGISLLLLKPTGSVEGLMNEFIRDPIGTAVEMFASMKAFELVGVIGGKVIKTTGKQATTYAKSLSKDILKATENIKRSIAIAKLRKAAMKLRKASEKELFKNKAIRKTLKLELKPEIKAKLKAKITKVKQAIKSKVDRPIRITKKTIRVSGEAISSINSKALISIKNTLGNVGIRVRFAKFRINQRITNISTHTLRKVNIKILKVKRALRISKGKITQPILRALKTIEVSLKNFNIRLKFIKYKIGQKIKAVKILDKPIRTIKRKINFAKEGINNSTVKFIRRIETSFGNLSIRLKFTKYKSTQAIKNISFPIRRNLNIKFLKLKRLIRKSKEFSNGIITKPIRRMVNSINNILFKLNYRVQLIKLKVKAIKRGARTKIVRTVRPIRKVIRISGETLNKINSRVVNKVKTDIGNLGIRFKFTKFAMSKKINSFSAARIRNINIKLLKLKRALRISKGKITQPVVSILTSIKTVFGNINIRIKFINVRIGTNLLASKRAVFRGISKPIRKGKFKINKTQRMLFNKLNKTRVSVNRTLGNLGIILKFKKFGLMDKISRLNNSIFKLIDRNIRSLRRELIKTKGRINKRVRSLKNAISKKIPITIEIITKKTIIKKIRIPQVTKRKGKIRTVARSSRKRRLNELKKRAKKEPSIKKLIKARRGREALKREKERRTLRKQDALMKKIATGKQIKATRIFPTEKGYAFENIFSNKIIYFTSRKAWTKAIIRQNKILKSITNEKMGLTTNLIRIRRMAKKKTPEQIKKILRIEKERMNLKRKQKLEQKQKQGKQIKSVKGVEKTTKGYALEDIFSGKIRYFASRKKWLKTITRQNKILREIMNDKSGLTTNLNKIFKNINKQKKLIAVPKTRKLALEKFKQLQKVKRTKETPKQTVIRLDKEIKNIIKKEKTQSMQEGKQIQILKQMPPKQKVVKVKQLQEQKLVRQKQISKAKIKAKILGNKTLLKALVRASVSITQIFSRQVSSISVQKSRFAQTQISKQKQLLVQVQKQKAKLDIALKQSQTLAQSQVVSVVQSQLSKLKALIKQLQAQKSMTKTKLKTIQKTILKIQKIPKPKIPKPFIFVIPTWKSKIKRGYKLAVNVIVRVRGKNKELKLKTTPNRALRKILRLIDNTTSRSFQLKIVGLIKGKDISKQSLAKFRLRRGKNPRVLKFVEKSKYAIDTKGEKSGLKIGKLLKRGKKKIKRKKR